MNDRGARDRRRDKRELEHGPEREIVVRKDDGDEVLSCGHVIVKPPAGITKLMRPPKFRRCAACT